MKNKINNEGFTLIELLGVIVILVLVLLVAIPNIASTFEKNKKKLIIQKQNVVLNASEIYANKYKKYFDYNSFLNGNCGISVANLKEKELITEDELLDGEGNVIYEDDVLISYDLASGKPIIGGYFVCPAVNPDNINYGQPNHPILDVNMIPVYYDGTVWRKADRNNEDGNYLWYNYEQRMWANAVTVTELNGSRTDLVNASNGTEIPMDRINTMWVWIPRFIATGNYDTYNGTNDINNPGAFDITFVNTSTSAHEAFTLGSKELSGFWTAKFMSGAIEELPTSDNYTNDATTNVDRTIIIKPNIDIWTYSRLATYYTSTIKMNDASNGYGFSLSVDPHVSKNSEWGAILYFTQSIYGTCTTSTSCTEVEMNNSKITGVGAEPGSGLSSDENGEYNTELGMGASSTNNIYGVYDLAGLRLGNYVMAFFQQGDYLVHGLSTGAIATGFNGCVERTCETVYTDGVDLPNSKYYDVYTNTGTEDEPITNYTFDRQHALTETAGWYNTAAKFIYYNQMGLLRGMTSGSVNGGFFSYTNQAAGGVSMPSGRAFRVILVTE